MHKSTQHNQAPDLFRGTHGHGKGFSWDQLLLPNIAVILFLAALPLLFQANNSFLTDPATPRHLRAGEIFLQTHHFFRTNPFGYAAPPLPWIDFEWLFEAAAALLYYRGGLPLLYSTGFILFALIPVLLWRLLIRQRVHWISALIYVLAASLFFRAHFLLRPFLLTYLFMIIVISRWHQRADQGPGFFEWFVLLPLFILWSNIHGGFTAGLLFLGLSLMGRFIDQSPKALHKKNSPLLLWGLFILAAFLSTLINPYGWHLYAKILEMMFKIKSFVYWDEFMAPNFNSLSILACALLLIIGTFVLNQYWGPRHQWTWETVLPLLVFFYFGLKTQRHILLFVLVAAIPVCQSWQAWIPKRKKRALKTKTFQSREEGSLSHQWMIPLVALSAIFFFLRCPSASSLRFGARNITSENIEFVRNHLSEFHRPLTTTGVAGPLLYYLAPDFKVSFDDRTDLYGDALLQPYINLLFLKPGWEKTLQQGNYDSAIIEKGFPLAQTMKHLPGWKAAWEDERNVVFIREP